MDAWKTPHIGPWKNSCDLGMAVTDLTWRYITTMVLSSQPQKWSGVHPPDWRKTTNLGGVASSLLLLILQIILCTLKWRIAIRYTIKNCLLGATWSPKNFMFPFRIPWKQFQWAQLNPRQWETPTPPHLLHLQLRHHLRSHHPPSSCNVCRLWWVVDNLSPEGILVHASKGLFGINLIAENQSNREQKKVMVHQMHL